MRNEKKQRKNEKKYKVIIVHINNQNRKKTHTQNYLIAKFILKIYVRELQIKLN